VALIQTQPQRSINMRYFLLVLFFILGAHICFASTPALKPEKATSSKPAVLKNDTSVVNIRHFDSVALKAYSKQREFQYNEESVDVSWWGRFWHWFWSWLSHLFDFGSKGLTMVGIIWKIIKILLLGGAAAALVYFVFNSSGLNLLSIFKRKPDSVPIPYSEFFEDINTIDFDAEIENAVAKHNYRFAVRLLYLKCLKQLTDSGLIAWQIDKTNSNYINELTNDEQRSAFKQLTRQFEYVWYGEFLIDEPIYKNIDSSFKNFNNHLA
jgi:hypothetical protein